MADEKTDQMGKGFADATPSLENLKKTFIKDLPLMKFFQLFW